MVPISFTATLPWYTRIMSPMEVLQVTADEVARTTEALRVRGVPEVPGLLVMLNATLRLILRAGVSSDLILEMVRDSLMTVRRQG